MKKNKFLSGLSAKLALAIGVSGFSGLASFLLSV